MHLVLCDSPPPQAPPPLPPPHFRWKKWRFKTSQKREGETDGGAGKFPPPPSSHSHLLLPSLASLPPPSLARVVLLFTAGFFYVRRRRIPPHAFFPGKKRPEGAEKLPWKKHFRGNPPSLFFLPKVPHRYLGFCQSCHGVRRQREEGSYF